MTTQYWIVHVRRNVNSMAGRPVSAPDLSLIFCLMKLMLTVLWNCICYPALVTKLEFLYHFMSIYRELINFWLGDDRYYHLKWYAETNKVSKYKPPSCVGAHTTRTKFAPLPLVLHENLHRFTPAGHFLAMTRYCWKCHSLQSGTWLCLTYLILGGLAPSSGCIASASVASAAFSPFILSLMKE